MFVSRSNILQTLNQYISKFYFKMSNCKLCCIKNCHKPINLPHNESVIVGRNEITGISDSTVSRSQVKLLANLQSCTVQVVPLGVNPCGANGYCLKQHKEYYLKHKDRLEILIDQFIYEIIFDPAPDQNVSDSKKRKFDAGGERAEESKKKIPNHNLKHAISEWEEIDGKKLYIFTSAGVEPLEKIAAYDLDGTIISTKSGARFPKNVEDWMFLFPEVSKKLHELHANHFKIVIFTNQAGIGLGRIKITEFQQKIEAIVAKLAIPIQVFVSTGKGVYRKPAPGMWDALVKQKNNGIEIDVGESFYCGDAAGRDKNWAPKKKKDHSIGDRLFALNVNLTFKTPEEHFLGARKIKHLMPEFDPRNIIKNCSLLEPATSKMTSNVQEVIVFVGAPGSGKSYICKNLLVPRDYLHINRDKLGSWQNCAKALETAILKKQSVVIDNTNPDIESRKRYLDVAKKHNTPCRCFVMNTSVQHAKHNNLFREMTDRSHQIVTDIIINSYKNKYEDPKVAEGFSEIVNVNCIPKFDNPEHERLYNMFLLEK